MVRDLQVITVVQFKQYYELGAVNVDVISVAFMERYLNLGFNVRTGLRMAGVGTSCPQHAVRPQYRWVRTGSGDRLHIGLQEKTNFLGKLTLTRAL
jgi:hypothetical protein